MKTKDLAEGLQKIINLLKSLPNQDVQDLKITDVNPRKKASPQEIALNLSTLFALSKIDKQQWKDFIAHCGFDIQIRPRDASRDILGKLLNYIDKNPQALNVLRQKTKMPNAKIKSPLLDAFDALLKNTKV